MKVPRAENQQGFRAAYSRMACHTCQRTLINPDTMQQSVFICGLNFHRFGRAILLRKIKKYAQTRTRTRDICLFRAALSQLSYLGTFIHNQRHCISILRKHTRDMPIITDYQTRNKSADRKTFRNYGIMKKTYPQDLI